MFNIFDKDTGVAEDKWVSFAFTAVPPGESGDMKHWLRAVYTDIKDAMPIRFEAIAGSADTYKLKNLWPGAEGYLCGKRVGSRAS